MALPFQRRATLATTPTTLLQVLLMVICHLQFEMNYAFLIFSYPGCQDPVFVQFTISSKTEYLEYFPKLAIDKNLNHFACPLRLDVFRLVLEHEDTCINIYSSYHFMSFFQKPISERFSLGGLLSYRPFSYCAIQNRIHKLFYLFYIT